MVLNVKKSNFIIYITCLLVGLIMIGVAIILFAFCPNTIIDEILLSIGCSTIPTVITAYLIDRVSEKSESERIKKLRKDFLWGMPHGLLWIMKIIVERYYPISNSNDKSFYSCFLISIEKMKSIQYGYEETEKQTAEISAILKSIDYGVSLCIRDCQSIILHDYELEINSIFTKEQILAVSYLLEECQNIMKSFILSEMAENIELFVNTAIENISEIKVKAERILNLNNGIVRNWYEISK